MTSLKEIMLKIISVGRNKMFRAQEEDYLKRIKSFSKIDILSLKEQKENNSEQIKKKEAENILSAAKGKEFFVLDPCGKEHTSESFAELIKANPNAVFVIGGAYGLSKEIISKSKKSISLSKMTFTHEIARVLLLEQIYRAFAIIKGRKYHK